ncbi:MAG TPA: YicC family protein [Bacteroidales bacterium]|nr:YicC family protein [Bacteroidales bacterium]HPE56942.1 YicC family protein [Bacteroidales bacterium]HRX96386.1 YicC family protein [Bacteroidales bacterium]
MIKSMTGFGKAECVYNNRKLIIEIKSLNSKFTDINARIPNGFREKEFEFRNKLSAKLQRGKIDFTITIESSGDGASYAINRDLVKKYYSELKAISGEIDLAGSENMLQVIMRMPDVMVPSREEISTEEWNALHVAIDQALEQLDEFRVQEGASLLKDLIYRNNKILELLEQVPPFEKDRIENLKAKIKKDVYEVVDQEDVDKNRFEQELIYYLDRLDITEEKVRLKKHCKYFLDTLDESESQGKKLGFISQEIGREINTLGSKALDANIQKLVVQMKDELEKIKEQLYNIL